MKALRENNRAAFAHIPAARYAAWELVGASHNLLIRNSPRVRFVSVFTSAKSPGSHDRKGSLHQCEACAKCCPKKAIRMRSDRVVAIMTTRPACRWPRSSSPEGASPAGSVQGLPHRERPHHLQTTRSHEKNTWGKRKPWPPIRRTRNTRPGRICGNMESPGEKAGSGKRIE